MKLVFLLLFTLFSQAVTAQNLLAKYKVSQVVDVSPDPEKPNFITLDFEGSLFKSGAKHLYYQKPLYLEKYPAGFISVDFNNSYSTYNLITDTLQRIFYNDMDSMILRYRTDLSSPNMPKDFIYRRFEPGAQQWNLLAESKTIDGLKCQRAKAFSYTDTAQMTWDVWFCPEIPMTIGPSSIRDVPGLIVEATSIRTNETYLLTSYYLDADFPDTVFWPKEFNGAKFKQWPVLKNRKGVIEKSDKQKRAEILDQ